MFELGLNIDRFMTFSPEEIAETGARWVRFPVTPYVDSRDYLTQLKGYGIKWEMLIDSDSMAGIDWQNASYEEARAYGLQQAETYAYYYDGYANKIQVGNEPDGNEESSWRMDPEKFALLLEVFRDRWSEKRIIAGGLVSGNETYLDSVGKLHLVDGISIHPYGQGLPDFPSPYGIVGDVGQLTDRYRRYHDNVEYSEFGVNHAHFDNQFAAEYASRMLRYLVSRGQANYFCLSDKMVPEFGIKDQDDNKKPLFSEFRAIASDAGWMENTISGLSIVRTFRRLSIQGVPGLRPERRVSAFNPRVVGPDRFKTQLSY